MSHAHYQSKRSRDFEGSTTYSYLLDLLETKQKSLEQYKQNIVMKFLKVVFFSLCSIVVNCQSDEDECRTPLNENGRCITIKDCKYLSEKFSDVPKPLNADQINALQSYHCGFDSTTLKVCCPVTVDAPINQYGVSNHRNLRLINQNNCGGKVASLSKHPWMALIAYTNNKNDGTEFRCSGTLINENYILTAAHCITNLKSFYVTGIRLGEYDLKTEIDCYHPRKCAPKAQDYNISDLIPHSGYNPTTMANDIGLLRLSKPADILTETIKPTCLPLFQNSKDLLNHEAIVTGWGATSSGYLSSQLVKISLPILSQNDCQQRYNAKNTGITITDRQICAGGIQGKDSCSGDGGAPLGLANAQGIFIQHGIVSFGSRYCGIENNRLPGVYTNVHSYIDWILDTIRD